ncbi:Ig-like domain-containing protein [Hymenobacter terrenus]|uniref:Ig-like domain-containing protein n=1 Tax=Hymenobacter terrenus TaxID=1629124 RepID=UPI0012E0314E|nr:Ig-like domain-containing protein [Hymenobacter terrenus]
MNTGDGWDISHKGIFLSNNDYVNNVELQNLYVHHYRGEILYTGGPNVGRLHVNNVRTENTNGSDFNLYGADLLVENCEFGGPSRFWMELLARPNQGNYATDQAVIRNNYYHDALGGTGIVLTQGDYLPYEFTFENNRIENGSFGAWGLYGGVAGPVNIAHNTITNCAGPVLEFGEAPGWLNNGGSANVTFEHNTITKSASLVSFFAKQRNIAVRNNTFTGYSAANPGLSTSVFYGASDLINGVVEGNLFTNCRTPEQTTGIGNERPLFRNNSYANAEWRELQGYYNITPGNLNVTPHFEYIAIAASVPNLVPRFETVGYANDQRLEVFAGSVSNPVRFATGQASYYVAQDRVLDGTQSLFLHFDGTQGKWVEDPATTVASVSVTPARATVAVGSTQQLFAVVSPWNVPNLNVSWQSGNPAVATVDANGLVTIVGPGTAVITVTTQQGGQTATSTISTPTPGSTTSGTNLALNPSFDADGAPVQSPIRWSTWVGNAGTDTDADYTETYGGAHSGTYHGTHYKASDYEVFTYQVATGLTNGLYTLRAWTKSSGGQSVAVLLAKNYGGAQLMTTLPPTPGGSSGAWQQVEVRNINVTNGQCELGFYSLAAGGQWIHFDDVELVKQAAGTARLATSTSPQAAGPLPTFESWPNPVQDRLTVSYPSLRPHPLEVRVFSQTGQLVLHQQQMLVPGGNVFSLPTSTLSPGLYLLQTHDGERMQHQRIQVTRP